MSAEAVKPARSRRRFSPRLVGAAAVVVVIAAMALDTTYRDVDAPPITAGGREAFDPAKFGRDTFAPKLVPELEKRAVPLGALLPALADDPDATSEKYGKREGTSPYSFAVSGTGVAGKVESGLMPVRIKDVPKDTRVSVQVGPAINGTALRDASGFVSFNQFINQVDYADAATALNDEVKARVLKGVDAEALEGRRISFIGAFTLVTPAVVTVTPVKLGEEAG
jgi:predicted lipoprotein